MPQAIDRLLATPMIRPRFPAIRPPPDLAEVVLAGFALIKSSSVRGLKTERILHNRPSRSTKKPKMLCRRQESHALPRPVKSLRGLCARPAGHEAAKAAGASSGS